MWYRYRQSAAVAFLIFSIASPNAFAWNIATDVGYTAQTITLSGYSRTWKDPWDPYFDEYCGAWGWDDVYGYQCYAYVYEVWWAAVYSDVYGPDSQNYHSTYLYDLTDANDQYSFQITTPVGVWTSQGRHYAEQEFYVSYCYWGFCYPPVYAGRNDYHLGNTAAQVSNTCIHSGTPTSGVLFGDNTLSDNGTGYYHFLGSDPPNTDDWACANYGHQKIASVGLWWNQSPEIGIGDLSRQGGGSFPPHSSHQNGLDIDVRYVRNDGQEDILNFDLNPTLYDQTKTQELINSFCTLGGADVIFVDSRANLSGSCVNVEPGHHNHFHVRLPDWEGTGN